MRCHGIHPDALTEYPADQVAMGWNRRNFALMFESIQAIYRYVFYLYIEKALLCLGRTFEMNLLKDFDLLHHLVVWR